jgi:hypothetical protein
VVLLEFWLGLAIRYRLPRHKRMKRPSIGLVRDLLLRGSLRFDHLVLALQPQLDQAADGLGAVQFHILTCNPFVD